MVLEVTTLITVPGQRDAFLAEYRDSFREAFARGDFAGLRKAQLLRCIEEPNRVVVLIEWDDLAAAQRHADQSGHLKQIASDYLQGITVARYQ